MSEPSKYYAIKGRLRSNTKKIFGIFYLILNREFDAIDTASVVISLYEGVYEIDPKSSVVDFDNRINSLKTDGQYALTTTQTLQEAIKSIAGDYSFYREIDPYLVSMDNNALGQVLQSFFGGILEDKKMGIEVNIQPLTEEEVSLDNFKSVPVDEEEINSDGKLDQDIQLNEIDDPNGTSVTSGQKVVEANFILAPVGGTLVNHLKTGDQVMVRILPNTAMANQEIEALQLRDPTGHIKSVAAEVISFTKIETGYQVIVQIKEGLCGEIHEEECVLIKTADNKTANKLSADVKGSARPSAPPPIPKPNKNPSRKEAKSSVMLMVGVSAIVLILILTFLLLASGI